MHRHLGDIYLRWPPPARLAAFSHCTINGTSRRSKRVKLTPLLPALQRLTHLSATAGAGNCLPSAAVAVLRKASPKTPRSRRLLCGHAMVQLNTCLQQRSPLSQEPTAGAARQHCLMALHLTYTNNHVVEGEQEKL